ncbi:MAG: phosphatase PAP2 family protein [Pseudomonadota bacterium]
MNLSELDTHLFFWINQGQRNPFFDLIMPYITEFDHWKYLILVAWLLLFALGGKKMKIALGLTAILVGLLDYSNSFFFKHLFTRPRPCNVLAGVHTFWPCPRSFSFPSNHAANIFGAVFFLSYIYRSWSFFLLPVAILVGYSRVYVGEHYPFDVLGGAFLGALGAGLAIVLWRLLISKWPEKKPGDRRTEG